MTLEFNTPDALYAHYQEVAHRIGSRRYVYPIVPIAVGISPRLVATPTPKPAPIAPLVAELTPEEFWEKMEALNYPRSRRVAQRMIEIIAKKHGLTYEDIIGPRRFAPIIAARQEAYWWLHRKFKLSAPETSSLIGNRDHTCVLQGIKKHEKRLANAK
jgi:hypothetical protein